MTAREWTNTKGKKNWQQKVVCAQLIPVEMVQGRVAGPWVAYYQSFEGIGWWDTE